MTVLVSHAGAHSATPQIAEQIADRLHKSGFEALVVPASEVASVRRYEAVVLGGAIHQHAWSPEAFAFLTRFAAELGKKPLWLFSGDSIGEAASSQEASLEEILGRARDARPLARPRRAADPRDYRHFAGGYERGHWELLGDLFWKVCGGLRVDPRNWRDIDAWASAIARDLQKADHQRERKRLHVSVRGKP